VYIKLIARTCDAIEIPISKIKSIAAYLKSKIPSHHEDDNHNDVDYNQRDDGNT